MRRIGRYEVQAELGRGGFGQVFRAYDPTVGRAVAIKVLLAAEDPELLLRFRSEAAAAGKLRHRNIVTIYDFGEQDHIPYLVMEYLEGDDLERIIAGSREITLLQKLDIMAQTASGLHHAHLHGTVHRDIKPANIMILADGTVKIMDFGIALLSQATAARITPQGSLVGTFPYMAPEQFYGAVSDSLTDLFAYGVTCYKLLTGTHPFQAPEMASVMFNIVNKTPAPLRSLVPQCPEALEDAVSKMLAKERDARYQSLEDVKFDLEPIIAELGRERMGDLIRETRALIDSGEFDSAQFSVRQALEIDPGNRTARELRDQLQRLIKDRALRPQIAALIDAGQLEIQAQHYEQAIRKFESALRLDKSNTKIQELIQGARTAWEQLQRADRLVIEAHQALRAGELTAANKGITDALSAFPDHTQAKTLLAEIRQKMEARERENLLRDGITRVRGFLLLRSFDAALEELNRLHTEYPESTEVTRLLAEAITERDAQIRRERVQSGVDEVKQLIKGRQFAKAADLASRLVREFPESKELADLGSYAAEEDRSQRRAAMIAEVMAEASALVRAGQFDEAIARLRNALQEHPTASSLREVLQTVSSAKSERARKVALERTSAEAAELIANGSFSKALDRISAFTTAYGEAAELDRLRRSAEEELEKQRRIAALRKLLLEAQGLIDEGRPGTASQVLQQATVQFPGDPALTQLLGVAQDRVREQRRVEEVSNTISEAENLSRSERFDESLQLLAEALKRYPREPRLVRCKEGIVAAKAAKEQQLIRTQMMEKAKALRQDGHLEAALDLLKSGAESTKAGALTTDDELAHLATQIETERQDKRRREQIRQTVMLAESLIAKGELLSATTILGEAARKNPSNAELTRLIEIANTRQREEEDRKRKEREREREEQEARKRKERAEAERAQARQQELNRVTGDLKALIAAAGFEDAAEQLRAALEKFGPEADLLELQEQNNSHIRRKEVITDALSRAENLRVAGELSSALQAVDQALQQVPGEPSLIDARSRIQADIARKERSEAVAKIFDSTRALFEMYRLEDAISSAHEGLTRFPDEPRLADLLRRAEHELRKEESRRELARIGVEAAGLLRAGRPEEAIGLLESVSILNTETRDLLNQARAILTGKRRDELLREALDLCGQSRYQDALAVLQRATLQYGDSPETVELRGRLERELNEQQRREARELDFAKLLTLEARLSGIGSRGKLRRARQEAAGWVLAHPDDEEIAQIGSRIQARIDSALAERRTPTKWIVTACMAAAAAFLAFLLTPRFHNSSPVPVEIRTDPPGATVRLGSRSCVTPNCQFDIEPGQYTIEASLAGYQGLKRPVTIYTGRERHYMDFSLEPLPPPTPASSTVETATLTVRTGQPRALIFVDNVAQKRTGEEGSATLVLPAGTHFIRSEKPGFVASPEQKIAISAHENRTLALKLVAQPVAPELKSARTEAGGSMTGAQSVPTISAPAPSPAPSPEVVEAQEWLRARSSGDPAQLRNFIAKFPASSHLADAQAQVDDIDWSRVNTSDVQSLNAYTSQYPHGRHSREAAERIADLDWLSVDKGNEDALRDYLTRHPNSSHQSQAASLISTIEANKAAERSRKEPAIPQTNVVPGVQPERVAIETALMQFNAAFQKRQPKDVKKIWPSVPAKYTNAMRVSGSSFVMYLSAVALPEVNGDVATVACDLLTATTVSGQPPKQTHKPVKVRLQKVGDSWSILDPLGS